MKRPRYAVRGGQSAQGLARALSSLLAAAWVALAVYCLLAAIAGPAGALALKGLQARRDGMARNLGELEAANLRLRGELESLRTDPDRALREARSLGYLRPNETEIVLAGSGAPKQALDAGRVLPFGPSPSLPDDLIKELALGAFLAALAAGLAFGRRRS